MINDELWVFNMGLRRDPTYLPTGCREKAGGGGCGQSLVGMATGASCWPGWHWRCDHSRMDPSPEAGQMRIRKPKQQKYFSKMSIIKK